MAWAHLPWRLTLTMLVALAGVCVGLGWDLDLSLNPAFEFSARRATVSVLFYSALLLMALFVFWRTRGTASPSYWFLLLGFGLLAVLSLAWAQYRWVERSAYPIPAQWSSTVQLVQLRIAAMPTRTDYGWRMLVQPDGSAPPFTPALPAQMSLSWTDEDLPVAIDQLRVGQVWRLPVHIRAAHATQNAGVFDQRHYWLAQDIGALAYVRLNKKTPPDQFPQLIRTEHSLRSTVENWRFDTLRAIDAALADTTAEQRTSASVFKALALGDQAAVSAAQWQLFQDTGVTHLVSISGLHVTVLAGILAWWARALWRRNVWLTSRVPALHVAQWVGLIGATAYALAAGWGLPAQRTVWMLALWLLLARLGVARSGLRVLGFSVLWVLIWDPFAVLSVGFWLSYGAVAWLIVAFDSFAVSDRLDNLGHGRAAQLEPSPSKMHLLARWFVGLVGAQLGISLSLLPMSLYFFGQTSLLGVAVNFVAIPLMSVMLVPLLLSVLLLLAFGWASPVLWMNAWLAQVLQGLKRLQGVSPVYEWVGRIELWQVLALFVLSLIVTVRLRALWHGWGGAAHTAAAPPHTVRPEPMGRRSSSALLVASLVLTVAVVKYPANYPRVPEGQLRVTVMDVGQGSAVLLQTAHQNWLYDTGARFTSEADAGARIIVPHLRHIGVRHIDTLVLSHNDSDHTGGTASVLHGVMVGQVLTSLTDAQLVSAGVWNLPVQHCQAGQTQQFDGVKMVVLSPDAAALNDVNTPDNQKSCVLRFEVMQDASDVQNSEGLRSILLTGDMDMLTEAKLLIDPSATGTGLRSQDERTSTPFKTDVVLIPHHGSDTSSSAPLIVATQPKWAVAQVGRYNAFGHPRAAVLQRYRDAGVQVWRTDEQYARVFVLGAGAN